MIVIAFVQFNTIVLNRTREAPRDRFVTRRTRDISTRGHRSDQIRGDLFGALPANVESGQILSFTTYCRHQRPQTIVLAVGDVHQFMGQHADHSFVRTKPGEKNRPTRDHVRPA